MPVISSCVVCKYQFTQVNSPVKCDGCSYYVHGKCSKLSLEELKCLRSKSTSLKFFCEWCEHDLNRLVDIGQLSIQSSVNILKWWKNNIVIIYNWTKGIVENTQMRFVVITHINKCENQVAVDLFIELTLKNLIYILHYTILIYQKISTLLWIMIDYIKKF